MSLLEEGRKTNEKEQWHSNGEGTAVGGGRGGSPQDQGITQRLYDPTGRQEEHVLHAHSSKEEEMKDQRGSLLCLRSQS